MWLGEPARLPDAAFLPITRQVLNPLKGGRE